MGSMFVGSQNCSWFRGRNFVGSKFRIILINITGKEMLVYTFVGIYNVNSWARASHEKPQTLAPPRTMMIPQSLISYTQ